MTPAERCLALLGQTVTILWTDENGEAAGAGGILVGVGEGQAHLDWGYAVSLRSRNFHIVEGEA